jgi:hypothetical protein
MTSVAHYHEACFPEDPNGEDPLAEFGAVGGEILNFDPARAAALWDALICYDKTHCQFKWEHLGQLLKEVAKIEAKTAPCFPFTDPTISRQFFCLSLEPLSRIAHAVVTVQQILEVLMIFLGKDPKTSFMLHPDYRLLRLLERSAYDRAVVYALLPPEMPGQREQAYPHLLPKHLSHPCRQRLEQYSQLRRFNTAQNML